MLQTMMMLKDGAGSDDEVEFVFRMPSKRCEKNTDTNYSTIDEVFNTPRACGWP